MMEPNSLETLLALRILIEALQMDEANAPPEEAQESKTKRKRHQAKGDRSA